MADKLLLMTGAAASTVIVTVPVAIDEPAVAVIVTVDVPAAVGVPVIAPVVELRDSPAGKPVAP